MEKVILRFMPDLKEDLCFEGLFTLDECFDKIKETCETFKEEDLRYAEFMVFSEEDKPMCIVAGWGHQIKDGYEELEPIVLEIYNKYILTNKYIMNSK